MRVLIVTIVQQANSHYPQPLLVHSAVLVAMRLLNQQNVQNVQQVNMRRLLVWLNVVPVFPVRIVW